MLQTWSSWKRFPDGRTEGRIEAPAGPGVYEVRHSLTGRVIAFGSTGHVADALLDLKQNGATGLFARLFKRQPSVSRAADLEYRTCAAGSRAEARVAAHRLVWLRQNALRRRVDIGLSA
jgi:hypothetical protein